MEIHDNIISTDHNVITFKITSEIKYIIYRNENYKLTDDRIKLFSKLFNISYKRNVPIFNNLNIDDNIQELTEMVQECCVMCFKKTSTRLRRNFWWTSELTDFKKRSL